MVPIVWSVAGTDSGGGAGLAADQRAADAFGVHLCPVVAAVTAQNSVAVTRVMPIGPDLLEAQLAALAQDMPPRVIKTGLLGSAANARVVARWVDRLRAHGPVQLVVDPVLRASTGASFADAELLRVYRGELLPRANVVTPNRAEAQTLLSLSDSLNHPSQAAALQALGALSVVLTGGDASTPELSLDWLQTPHAQGWLSLPRVATRHHHGTGCSFATALASALARGFVSADAAVLAKMATTHALRQARAVGHGAGPVIATPCFGNNPSLLPHLSLTSETPTQWLSAKERRHPGVYAIVDSAARAKAVLGVSPTVDTLQLRMKRPDGLSDHAWIDHLRKAIHQSQQAAGAAGAWLVINDHWQTALDCGAQALHLGQEDLLSLSDGDFRRLQSARAKGVQLGLSSHSLWELCRAAALEPDYIACGPVWPTTTKDMPWHPQGLDNLAWWAHMAPAPVVGIGGLLTPDQLRDVAAAGAAGGCVVRGLGNEPALTLPTWLHAWTMGAEQTARLPIPTLPHPSLTPAGDDLFHLWHTSALPQEPNHERPHTTQ